MKKFIALIALLPALALADTANEVLSDVYGKLGTCLVDTDVDDGQADRVGPMTAGVRYVVYCYDSSDWTGVACRVLQGGSSVDASTTEGAAGEGEILFAGEKRIIRADNNFLYVSFEALADGTTQVGALCRVN